MLFYTIQSREFGTFCGFKRKWIDLWLKRPIFKWEGFAHQGKTLLFHHEKAAQNFLTKHADIMPADCTIALSDLGTADSLARTIHKSE